MQYQHLIELHVICRPAQALISKDALWRSSHRTPPVSSSYQPCSCRLFSTKSIHSYSDSTLLAMTSDKSHQVSIPDRSSDSNATHIDPHSSDEARQHNHDIDTSAAQIQSSESTDAGTVTTSETGGTVYIGMRASDNAYQHNGNSYRGSRAH